MWKVLFLYFSDELSYQNRAPEKVLLAKVFWEKEEEMIFKGISKNFSLKNEEQYQTIGAFWDEMAEKYGLEHSTGVEIIKWLLKILDC